jgi:hypothetical protein
LKLDLHKDSDDKMVTLTLRVLCHSFMSTDDEMNVPQSPRGSGVDESGLRPESGLGTPDLDPNLSPRNSKTIARGTISTFLLYVIVYSSYTIIVHKLLSSAFYYISSVIFIRSLLVSRT